MEGAIAFVACGRMIVAPRLDPIVLDPSGSAGGDHDVGLRPLVGKSRGSGRSANGPTII
jgi:hypothetical protein